MKAFLGGAGYKPWQSDHPPSNALHIFGGPGWLHVEDGLDLFRVCLDPSLGYQKTQEFPTSDPKCALLLVEIDSKLVKVVNVCLRSSGCEGVLVAPKNHTVQQVLGPQVQGL